MCVKENRPCLTLHSPIRVISPLLSCLTASWFTPIRVHIWTLTQPTPGQSGYRCRQMKTQVWLPTKLYVFILVNLWAQCIQENHKSILCKLKISVCEYYTVWW